MHDIAKDRQATEEVLADGWSAKVKVIPMDLGSFESVRAGAEQYLGKSGNRLNILINDPSKQPPRVSSFLYQT